MRLYVDREELAEVLKKAQAATEKKSALPVLNNFKIKAEDGHLAVYATDLENFLFLHLPARVEEEGTLAVNAKKFTEVIRSLTSAEVYLHLREDKLVVSGGRSTFKLAVADPEEFPEFPEISGSAAQINASTLLKAIDKTEYAISKEDSRYALQGLYLHRVEDKIHFVGSDGHRLALFWTYSDADVSVILPRKSLKVLEGFLKETVGGVSIFKDENFAHVKGENWTLSVRLLEGEYPDYLSVIPQDFQTQVVVDRDSLIASIKRLSAIAESSAFPVKISFMENLAVLEITEPEFGEGRDEVEVELEGEPVEIGFNGKYLLEALDSFDVRRVILKAVDPDSPVLMESEDPEKDPYLCLVMPMRL
ncbi:DNA polymerase III, beta subunit [Thermocrinis albus DSM 14484]|uniref:Beta sliding clamp n=1 Tax=Thermocrinis albus (strain DSM 14484 / JCM 11386 / HI 11/12) TaxID=638303 RepID=D3SM75_THEAH|nr:DNA polymerase III subunit beta [Thermocrinis albus]ADC89855.1 DNA polymerase III, beta subunit [Thermocrinis albus DSM 14484]